MIFLPALDQLFKVPSSAFLEPLPAFCQPLITPRNDRVGDRVNVLYWTVSSHASNAQQFAGWFLSLSVSLPQAFFTTHPLVHC